MKIEDSLNGCYQSLYGEIVDKDVFRLKDVADIVSINDSSYVHEHGHRSNVHFKPEIIYDIGSCVGIFARFASGLWPSAKIITVEPSEDNFIYLDSEWTNYKRAIGFGQMYMLKSLINGAHDFFCCDSEAFKNNDLMYDKTNIESLMIDRLIRLHGHINSIMKIDIEGNEAVIFNHEPSLEALALIDYLVIEIHGYANMAELIPKVKEINQNAFDFIAQTHNTELSNNYFYAVKK